MAKYIVTRKRHLYERVEVEAPSAAAAKRLADDEAAAMRTQVWGGQPENWQVSKLVEAR